MSGFTFSLSHNVAYEALLFSLASVRTGNVGQLLQGGRVSCRGFWEM